MTSDPKNIVIVTHHYPPHITGVGVVAQNQAQQLAALGHHVTVITSDTAPDEKSFDDQGVQVIRIKAWNISEKWNAPYPIFSLKLLPILFKYIRKADIVHVHDVFYISSLSAAILARWYKKPIVLTQHVAIVAHPNVFIMAVQKLVYSTTGALIFHLSNSILVYNNIVKQFLINDHGINPAKILELRNGVDLRIFRPAADGEKAELRRYFNLPIEKPIVLFVGRLVPKKGFIKLLEASDDAYDIVFAGPGGITDDRLRAPGIHCLGSMNQIELSKLYRTADMFVFPAEGEMFTLVMQEAMASGLPIITTDEKDYAKYTLDRDLIAFVNPTPQELKRNIQRLIEDQELNARMSTYSIALAQAWFNYESNLKSVFELYIALSSKPQKIAIVSDSIYPYNKGGKEKRIYDMTTRLAAQGYDVSIYCMKWWQGEKSIIRDSVTFESISPYYPLYADNRRSIKQGLLFALHCFKMFNKDFDIVEVDHIPHLVLFTMKIICMLKGKRMIVTWHEVWGKEYWQEYLGTSKGLIAYWIERVSVTLPDTIISVSDHTTKALRQMLGDTKEIITIPNGLNITEISANSPAKIGGADVIFAGRLLSHKNIDVLIRAIGILVDRNPNISLSIIGEGPEKPKLEILAGELGIKNNVSFQDFFEDHNDLYSIMHASGVFVLPSTREGFGIVVLEANACGLPVITINHKENAAKELVTHGENGMLTSLDTNEMADAIEKLLEDEKNGRNYHRYIEKYDWDTIISQIVRVYTYKNV